MRGLFAVVAIMSSLVTHISAHPKTGHGNLISKMKEAIAQAHDEQQLNIPADAEWEMGRMHIINGTREDIPSVYQPWNYVPPEHQNGDDEITTEDDLKKLGLPKNQPMVPRKFVYPVGSSMLWHNGIVLYKFATNSRKFANSNSEATVRQAMKWYEDNTCISFQEAPSSMTTRFVEIGTGSGCYAHIGVHNMKTVVGLKEMGCISMGTILHEFGHTLGMHHEHVRDDREDNINMHWDLIPEAKNQGINWGETDTENYAPYDLGSNMHYSLYAGSKIGSRMAMTPKDMELSFLASFRRPGSMTFYDMMAINHAYQCSDHCTNNPQCQHTGYVDFECKCHCPEYLTGQCDVVDTDHDCGGIIDLTSGAVIVQSPNYPNNFPSGKTCTWLFKAPVGNVIDFNITSFDIPAKGITSKWGERVMICPNNLEVRYHLIGQPGPEYCGVNWQRGNIRTTEVADSHLMLVRFTSPDNSLSGQGFEAQVSTRVSGCTRSSCSNGASCIDTVTTFICVCLHGFTGRYCEVIEDGTTFCDFENDTMDCPITQDQNDQRDWVHIAGPTPSKGTGPAAGMGGQGQYIYYEASNVQTGDVARLFTTVLSPMRRCFAFKYHMYGAEMGELKIFVLEGGVSRMVWKRDGDQGYVWHQASITVDAITDYKMVIEGVRGSGYKADIAIDNIHITPGYCAGHNSSTTATAHSTSPPTSPTPTPSGSTTNPSTTTASTTIQSTTTQSTQSTTNSPSTTVTASSTTESTTRSTTYQQSTSTNGPTFPVNAVVTCDQWTNCPITQDSTDDYDWIIHSGSTPSSQTGPTKGYGGSGNYIYFETSHRYSGDTARFFTHLITDGSRCVEFMYHMHGTTMGKLTVSKHDGINAPETPFIVSRNQGHRWLPAKFNVFSNGDPYYIAFEATRGSGFKSDIAIDHLVLTPGECMVPSTTVIPPIVNGQISCGFESVCVDLHVDTTANYDWKRHSGRTKSDDTGPDSGYQSTNYIYFETSNPVSTGDKARLVSSVYEGSTVCLSFNYHMLGVTMGSLTVKCLNDTNPTELFKKENNQGNVWHYFQTTFTSIQPFAIEFEGVKGASYTSDMALDNVNMVQGVCPSTSPSPSSSPHSSSPHSSSPHSSSPHSSSPHTPSPHSSSPHSSSPHSSSPGTPSPHSSSPHSSSPHSSSPHSSSPHSSSPHSSSPHSSSPHSSSPGTPSPHSSSPGTPSPHSSSPHSSSPHSSSPHTPSPHSSSPHTPSPHSSSPGTPSPHSSSPGTPSPHSSSPGTPSPHSSSPGIPSPHSSSPGTPSPHSSSPHSSSPGTPSPHSSSPHTPSPHTPSPHSSSPRTHSPHTPSPHTSTRSANATTPRRTAAPHSSSPRPTEPVFGFTCSFDTGNSCVFKQDRPTADDFDWKITNAASPSTNTGPQGDHGGHGYYLLVEASEPRHPGDEARLVSTKVRVQSQASCVQFWYHINGKTPSSLTLLIKVPRYNYDLALWTSDGSVSNLWRHVYVDIFPVVDSYRIVFEAVTGGWEGDIGLDDVTVTTGRCPHTGGSVVTGGWEGDIGLDDVTVTTGRCPHTGGSL